MPNTSHSIKVSQWIKTKKVIYAEEFQSMVKCESITEYIVYPAPSSMRKIFLDKGIKATMDQIRKAYIELGIFEVQGLWRKKYHAKP